MSLTGKTPAQFYKDLLHTDNSNTGISSTIKQIKCGDGDATALQLSDRNFKVQPAADSTTTACIYDVDGNVILTVDTTNNLVKVGTGQQIATTNYVEFHGTSLDVDGSSHLAVPRAVAPATQLTLGTGTNPDTSLTISTTADDVLSCMWYVDTAVVLDSVTIWSGANTSGGDTTRFHLVSYSIDTSNGSTGGDLSSGAVHADGGDITNAGYEQAYYQTLTIGTSSIAAGKAVFLTIKGDGTNSNYNVNCRIKYHLA